MNCAEFEVVLSSWIDGETTELEEKRLRRHLSDCRRCDQLRMEWLILSRLARAAQPTWLDNPAESFHVAPVTALPRQSGAGKAWRFEVDNAKRGMKWTAVVDQGEDASLQDVFHITVCYRASNVRQQSAGRPHKDYFILLYDKHENETIPFYLHDLVCDGEWHVVSSPLPVTNVHKVVVQVQTAEGEAFVEIASLRFTSTRGNIEVREFQHADWV